MRTRVCVRACVRACGCLEMGQLVAQVYEGTQGKVTVIGFQTQAVGEPIRTSLVPFSSGVYTAKRRCFVVADGCVVDSDHFLAPPSTPFVHSSVWHTSAHCDRRWFLLRCLHVVTGCGMGAGAVLAFLGYGGL